MTRWLKLAYFGGLSLLIFFILILSLTGYDIRHTTHDGQYQAIHAEEVKTDEILRWLACTVLSIGFATLIPLFIGAAKDNKYLLIPAMACITVCILIEAILLAYLARYDCEFYPTPLQMVQASVGLVFFAYIIIIYFHMDIWTGGDEGVGEGRRR